MRYSLESYHSKSWGFSSTPRTLMKNNIWVMLNKLFVFGQAVHALLFWSPINSVVLSWCCLGWCVLSSRLMWFRADLSFRSVLLALRGRLFNNRVNKMFVYILVHTSLNTLFVFPHQLRWGFWRFGKRMSAFPCLVLTWLMNIATDIGRLTFISRQHENICSRHTFIFHKLNWPHWQMFFLDKSLI